MNELRSFADEFHLHALFDRWRAIKKKSPNVD